MPLPPQAHTRHHPCKTLMATRKNAMKHAVLTGEPVSAVDRAWLEMDDPCNPMVISAIFQLEGPVDAAALQKIMVERLLRYPRFSQRTDRVPGAPPWGGEPS